MKRNNTWMICLVLIITLITSCKAISTKKSSVEEMPKLMWFDATANYARFSNPDSIDFYLNKIKQLGFTDAVVDIRPISGYVLYKSQYAPFLKEYNGTSRDENFDFLAHFISTAHTLGMRVHASMNTFVAGNMISKKGLIYEFGKESWASTVYTPYSDKLIPITEEGGSKYSAMINPINPEFQSYILSIFKEVAALYPTLDGIMLDRVRYEGITTDFSDFSRGEFEKHIGQQIANFPDDIFVWKQNQEGQFYPEKGKYFHQWINWRAQNIYDFMALAKSEVKKVNPKLSFGTYTGAWYPSYYEVGVNFASKKYNPENEFDWADGGYKKTGYAELIDLFTVGNYYTSITKEEYEKFGKPVKNETDMNAQKNIWYCVEGSNENLRRIMKQNKFIGGILVDQFYDNPDGLTESIKMNLKTSDGVMIFDIVHIINENLWEYVEKGMREGGAMKQ